MFGIGANYDGHGDMTEDFLEHGLACIGWPYNEAPSLHEIMRSFQVGDIIYIKSHPPHIGLIVKAIGIVEDSEVRPLEGHGQACVRVNWIWRGPAVTIGHVHDRYNVRNNTLYEEWNPDIRTRILNLLLNREQQLAAQA
ncbi:MAG: hypothetical protein ACM3S5_00470 [Rhodospirillales bacterium]